MKTTYQIQFMGGYNSIAHTLDWEFPKDVGSREFGARVYDLIQVVARRFASIYDYKAVRFCILTDQTHSKLDIDLNLGFFGEREEYQALIFREDIEGCFLPSISDLNPGKLVRLTTLLTNFFVRIDCRDQPTMDRHNTKSQPFKDGTRL